MIALTALMIAGCYVWIACDPWMQEAFHIYGRAFRVAVDMKAWDIMWRCGWRLCIVIATICASLWLAFDAIVLDGNDTTSATKVTWGVLAALAAMMVPSRFAIVAIQRRREIDALVNELFGAAQRIVTTGDMEGTFDPAGYDNDEDWIAWQPASAEFDAADDASIWRRIVPVFYTSPTHRDVVVIPIDWGAFVVWGALPSIPKIGEHLPFGGPGQAKFRLRSIRQSNGGHNRCMLLSTELDLSDEDTADDNAANVTIVP